jgi:hypothetical protein
MLNSQQLAAAVVPKGLPVGLIIAAATVFVGVVVLLFAYLLFLR